MRIKVIASIVVILSILMIPGCVSRQDNGNSPSGNLKACLDSIVSGSPGTIGVAVVADGDTVLVNNDSRYPMMSVFKLHQAIAVVAEMENRGISLDSVLDINTDEIDRDTWSPVLGQFGEDGGKASVAELLRYSVEVSDNNASNILFERIISPEATDAYIRSVSPDSTFCIRHSEADMKRDHSLSYDNRTSPLAVSLLLRKLMMDKKFASSKGFSYLREILSNVTTGSDRLAAVCGDSEMKQFVHKTGSGYRDEEGNLMAYNDVGHFTLRNGREYTVAVFIRDFPGTDQEAATVIASISRLVFKQMTQPNNVAY